MFEQNILKGVFIMKKRIVSLFLAMLMVSCSVSSVAFAADTQGLDESTKSSPLALGDPSTGFTMQSAVITPVVVRPGSTTKLALKQYARTTSLNNSFAQSAYWDSFNVNGFNQYVYDNNYQFVGWDVSVTGTYTAANQNSVITADKLRFFEYWVGDGEHKKVDIQYSTNRTATYYWFAEIEGDLTDYNSLKSVFNWKVTYIDGSNGKITDVTGRLTAMMTYWPNYGVKK